MTDNLEEGEPGYARKEAARRLAAAATDQPYEPKPAISLMMTHPWSNQGRAPAVLRLEDEVSGQQLFELELNAEQLHDLLASRTVRPHVRHYTRRPEVMGHPETMWMISSPTHDEAVEQRERLIDLGWTVTEPRRQRGHVSYVYQVTGRRWDGEPAGTMCKKCGWPIPNRFAAECPECDLS
jgi:hypothetical protein